VTGTLEQILDRIAEWRVPHSYFLHFYAASIISSLFWGVELIRRGPAFRTVASHTNTLDGAPSMSFDQIFLCWGLMVAQGGRRVWESIALAKPSESKMWFVHWLLGIGFYLGMGISIWVEGIRMAVNIQSRAESD
jgi:3-oxo-5-alpha-steroid 4-dehydrogenase 3